MNYEEKQELIEWRESEVSKALCKQIEMYGELPQKWQIGFVQCRPIRFEGSHTLTRMVNVVLARDVNGCESIGFIGI